MLKISLGICEGVLVGRELGGIEGRREVVGISLSWAVGSREGASEAATVGLSLATSEGLALG